MYGGRSSCRRGRIIRISGRCGGRSNGWCGGRSGRCGGSVVGVAV